MTEETPRQIRTDEELQRLHRAGAGYVYNHFYRSLHRADCDHVRRMTARSAKGFYASRDEVREHLGSDVKPCPDCLPLSGGEPGPPLGERDLCRGWTESDIRTAIANASDRQRAVLAEIANHPLTTTAEIAERLGWGRHENVRATLGAFARTTNAMGVVDAEGELSWPFVIERPATGSTFWRYFMPDEAAEVVRAAVGQATQAGGPGRSTALRTGGAGRGNVRYWLKLEDFTEAEHEPGYWERRSWISDSPGRRSRRWERRSRPRRGQPFPPYGPRYAIDDRIVVCVKGHGCPAILEVTTEPHWDPRFVDDQGMTREGDRWGVVTGISCLHSVPLGAAPQLDGISVAPTSVMQKGHVALQDWQYRRAYTLITGEPPEEGPRRPQATRLPIEQGEVEGYEVATRETVRRASRKEWRLVSDYCAFLEACGDVVERTKVMPIDSAHPLYSDILNVTRDQLIEAKAGTSRSEIRMAIGQIADYGRCVGPDTREAGLLEAKPHPDLIDLLDTQGIAAIWRSQTGFTDNADGIFT
ncbi:MAG: hypothetical protein AABM42_09380 [Actinomycetota bacterium]